MPDGCRTPADERMSVVYLGGSAELREIREWSLQHGVQAVDEPDRDSLCGVVDPHVLERPATTLEQEVLRRLRHTALPCFTPARAWPFLSSVVNRGLYIPA